MRPVLTLFAAAATTLILTGATQAQQRYLTWPGKVDQPAAAPMPTGPAAAGPRWSPSQAEPMPATPMAGDRYGPRRSSFPEPAYAPQAMPQPAPQLAAYAAPRPMAPPAYAPARTSSTAPRRPTIYDAAPIADTPTPQEQMTAPRQAAMAAPAPEAIPAPAPTAAQVASLAPPAAAQPWSADRGSAQGTPSRRYSVQREAAETAWGPEVAARYGNPSPAPVAPTGR